MKTQTNYAREIAGSTTEEITTKLLADLRHLTQTLSIEPQKREYKYLHRIAPDTYLATIIDTQYDQLTLYPLPDNKQMWESACSPIYGDPITCDLNKINNLSQEDDVIAHYIGLAVETTLMLNS